MNDKLSGFCESVHEKLESLQGRMDSLKLNVGTTWHSLQEKLEELRHQYDTSHPPLADARSNLEKWFNENNAENKKTVDQWVTTGDLTRLSARACMAEECAWCAIQIAEASINDAERMILEAIAAKLDAEAVTPS